MLGFSQKLTNCGAVEFRKGAPPEACSASPVLHALAPDGIASYIYTLTN